MNSQNTQGPSTVRPLERRPLCCSNSRKLSEELTAVQNSLAAAQLELDSVKRQKEQLQQDVTLMQAQRALVQKQIEEVAVFMGQACQEYVTLEAKLSQLQLSNSLLFRASSNFMKCIDVLEDKLAKERETSKGIIADKAKEIDTLKKTIREIRLTAAQVDSFPNP